MSENDDVTLAELVEVQAELSNRIERLERENDELEKRVATLEKREVEK